jgi:hypothetical protein
MRHNGATKVKLEGSLDTFSLRELIEMTVYSSVTGALNIYGQEGSGQIFFRDGQPYHACYSDLSGEQAVARLFEEHSGLFAFVADTISDSETIWYDPLELIELSERQAARWSRIRTQLSDLQLAPQVVSDPETAHLQIHPEHWAVFTAIDGQRALPAIAETLGVDFLEVCEAIVQLRDDGLITLRQLALQAPPAATAGAQEARRGARPGILDRLLASLPPEALAPPAVPPPPTPAGVAGGPAVATPPAEEDPILRLLRG